MSDEILRLLELELGCPSSFDEGVEAARNACAAGASIAAAAITAAAYYDNPLTGLGALRELMSRIAGIRNDLAMWCRALSPCRHPDTDDTEFTPGFGFVTRLRAERTIALCTRFGELSPSHSSSRCRFLVEHQRHLAALAGPLNETGLAALVYVDAGADIECAERRWLACKLGVALEQAQKARRAGIDAFPFSFARYIYDGPCPTPRVLDLEALKRQLRLDRTDG